MKSGPKYQRKSESNGYLKDQIDPVVANKGLSTKY